MNKENFLKEVARQRPSKINLALSDDASQLNASLDNIRVIVGEIFQEGNGIQKEEERVKETWGNLAEEGERILRELSNIISKAEDFTEEIETMVSELGINVNDIPYYQELQNNLTDTRNNEDSIVDGIRLWRDKASN
tara:strand:+ start:55 stop:465 length:411 start_codon:yes stop_codon:yes gene_type:complete